jgi:hypothetical protein
VSAIDEARRDAVGVATAAKIEYEKAKADRLYAEDLRANFAKRQERYSREGGAGVVPNANATEIEALKKAEATALSALNKEQKRREVWEDIQARVTDAFQQADDLQAAGYAPLMRFGKYFVTAKDAKGETLHRAHYENRLDLNAARLEFGKAFPGAKIETGIISEEDWKRFQGMTPETIMLFAEKLGLNLDEHQAAQKYYQDMISSRSALKRRIKREGIPGFSDDLSRVLASFITSNARRASSNYNMPLISEARDAIDERDGDVRDEAAKLVEQITNPTEDAPAARAGLYAYFIGGSLASAAVNFTQPLTMTLPYLGQWGNGRAGAAIAKAMRRTLPADMQAALKQANEKGITNPQEVYYLYNEAIRGISSNKTFQTAMWAWGAMFSFAENMNRRTTFLAAYEMWQGADAKTRAKMTETTDATNAFAFAERTIHETQGLYGKHNRPNLARGAIGATVFCVDESTEALTSRGWKNLDDVEAGDLFASFDMKTEKLVWMPAQSIHRFERNGEMVSVKSQGVDILMTPDHRCVTYRRRRVKGERALGTTYRSLEIVEAQSLTSSDAIPSAAEFDHTQQGEPIRDAIIPVLGWVITEGCFYPEGYICIYQNENKFADAIRADLKAAGISWTETSHQYENGNGLHTRFFINKTRSTEIRSLIPDKHLTPALLMRLSVPQIRVLVDKMIDGDGCVQRRRKPHHSQLRSFIQNEGMTLDSFQMALTMLGISYSVRKHNGGNCRVVILRESATTQTSMHHIGRASKSVVQYQGRVWCPIIPETNTWFARRNGMPFITHNTFKQYSIAYLELMSRLPPRQKAVMAAVLVLLAGLQGLPGADDLDDLIDTLGQMMGYKTNSKDAIRQAAIELLGSELGPIVTQGLSGASFSPIDVSGRLGMANLLPATSLFKRSEKNRADDAIEAVGPIGSVVKNAMQAFDELQAGDYFGAAENLLPVAFANMIKGGRIAATGTARDHKNKITVRDLGPTDAAIQAFGFQPKAKADESRRYRAINQDKNQLQDVKADIAQLWAEGIVDDDDTKKERAMQQLQDWNAKNPDTPIAITAASLLKRAKDMREDRAMRQLKSLPKEVRGAYAQRLTDR